ncbi:MAG: helix-turn-helix transcriptional regulator [Deltaproteobacteria bacterium]|nr:helix-turn-helix transcriptional regulator [Deltaproteobacteria bacterium]
MMNEPLPPTPLQRIRRAARLSQAGLARRAKVHPQTISVAERSGAVSEALARRLAAVLGCAPEALRDEGGEP